MGKCSICMMGLKFKLLYPNRMHSQLEHTVWHHIFQKPTIESGTRCTSYVFQQNAHLSLTNLFQTGVSLDKYLLSLNHDLTNVKTRTCMKPCNIPLSLGPKKRKGTPWFNAAFTCHVLFFVLMEQGMQKRSKQEDCAGMPWYSFNCLICNYL